ncbi:MAG TPA: tRNA 2-selenouridine(34) synthase MnmH [Pseudomonadales bacterium]
MNGTDPETLLAEGARFIDVRAPSEFTRGAVPGAINLPILDDDERHEVGSTYNNEGHNAAVALGYRLVSGAVRQARVAAWAEALDAYPEAWIYCWRGGQRSQIAQEWLHEAGYEVPRVEGGFKALRQCCLEVLARAPHALPWLVLAGRTGSGKTVLIRERPDSIDLEGQANHRGSAFGGRSCTQPSPISFENALAVAFLDLDSQRLIVEDESRTIGRLALPAAWHERMQTAPVVVVEADLSERVENIRREYVDEPLAEGVTPGDLQARYQGALERISRRLGGDRCRAVARALAEGFASGHHHAWIEQLLLWYYDPMYDYQLSKKQDRIVMQGDRDAVREFLATP